LIQELLVFEIRKVRAPQGRKKLVEERRKFFELIGSGYGIQESARIVGVNYRTAKRWRSGDTPRRARAAPVVTRPAPPSSASRYLSELDRIFIADRLLAGMTIRAIARELHRSPSTVSREVKRNAHPMSGAYRPYAAQARADSRRPRPKQGKIALNAELREYIQGKLVKRWSPEQIARSVKERVRWFV